MRWESAFGSGKIFRTRDFDLGVGMSSEGDSLDVHLAEHRTDPECGGRSFGPRWQTNLPPASGIEPPVFDLSIPIEPLVFAL